MVDESCQASSGQAPLSSSSSLSSSFIEELAGDEDQDNADSDNGQVYKTKSDLGLRPPARSWAMRRTSSLDDLLSSSFVHRAPDGRRIVVSRGWPLGTKRAFRFKDDELATKSNKKSCKQAYKRTIKHRVVRRSETANPGSPLVALSSSSTHHLSAEQKRKLLLDFLTQSANSDKETNFNVILGNERLIESALKIKQHQQHYLTTEPTEPNSKLNSDSGKIERVKQNGKPIIVQYQVGPVTTN